MKLWFVVLFLVFGCLSNLAYWYTVVPCVGCSVLSVSSMSDDESSPGSTVASSNPPSASTTAMNRPPLPQIKLPPPLSLAGCSAKKWKLWKQAWLNYAVVSKNLQSRCSTPESSFSLHYRSRCFRDLKRVSIQRKRGFRWGGNLNFRIRRILHGGGKRNIWTLRSLTRRTKKLVKASTLISSPWQTWWNLVTSVAAQQWATLYYETVSLSGFRMKMPGNGYIKKESSTWREVLIYAVLRRARRLTSRRLVENMKSPPGAPKGQWSFQEEPKQGEWTEASFEEKNNELRELKCKFCSQSHVLKKELCPAWSK